MKTAKTAIKYLVFGLVAGFLLAPRSGNETRRMLWDEAMEYVTELASIVREQLPSSGGATNA